MAPRKVIMQELIELIQLLNLGKLRSGSVWSTIMEPGSLMEKLFDAIADGSVATDEQAGQLLFGSDRVSAKLQSLKTRLRDRLIDVVFLLDFRDTGFTDRQKAYFECNKKWSSAMVLLSKGIKITSIDLLERLLKHTTHFEFTEITLNILYSLRLHYGTIQGDPKKYELYREEYTRQQQIWMKENNAEELYTHFVSHYIASRATKEEMVDQAKAYYARVAPDMAACDAFRLHLCGRLLELMVYSSENDYTRSAEACEAAIRFFEAKPYNSSLPLQAFYYQLVVCYVQLKEFERGAAIITRYQEIYEEGSYNWFKLQELFFLLAMHTQHYEDAFSTYERVIGHARLSAQPEVIQETWKIYEAFAHYLVQVGKVEQIPSQRFKLSKFLNDIPQYSKDKQGMNIPILIAQILFMFAEGKHANTVDRIEAINKYCSRYLKKNDTFRSNCFIKMLLQIPDAGFHREAVIRKSDKYLDMLRAVPMEIANQSHGIEIIPYEDLWDMTLEMLHIK
ncbi:MAG: hypothetical protein IPL65_15515 [Lewinellaceae bacterium]|nr:hypothetical protein [Lewinellaceae bacterium]